MDSDPSHGTQVSEPAPGDSIRFLVASFLSYLELRLQLLGLETRETGLHLLVLALLLVSTITFFAGLIAMLIVFLLYLIMLILHWEWGWSVLAVAGVLLVISIVFGLISRFRIVKRFFPVTFAELQRDRRWLEHTTKKPITTELAGVRIQLQDQMLLLRRNLKVGHTSWSRSRIILGNE